MIGYPRGFYLFLLGVLTLLVGSGVMLVPSLLDMRLGWEVPVSISGDLRLDSAAVHSLAGFLTLGALGSLTTLHVRRGWHRRLNHVSGTALLVLFPALLITAVAIYYLGDPDLSLLASVTHTLLGLAVTATLLWHQLNGRRIRARDRLTGWPSSLREIPGSPHRPGSARWPQSSRTEPTNS